MIVIPNTGVLLLAIGHRNYLEMACNLAMSIGEDTHITLAWYGCNPATLTEAKQSLFNNTIEIKEEYLLKNGKITPFRVKTLLNKITPYQNTLYLDVDVLFFNGAATRLIQEVRPYDFTIQNWGSEILDNSKPSKFSADIWANTHDLAEAYNLWGNSYSPTHSELIWFKKCEATDNLFALANEIFDNPKVKTAEFAGDVPDEFAFNVALSALKMQPHQSWWFGFWWANRNVDKKLSIEQIPKKYYGISMAGNVTSDTVVKRYQMILKYFAQKQGINNYWKFQSKRKWAANRQKY